MKYIKIFIITIVVLILTACSQNFQGYREPSGPPRNYGDLTYFTYDITDITGNVENEIPEGLEDYRSIREKHVEMGRKKFAELRNSEEEYSNLDMLALGEIEGDKVFEDKTLYTNIKLSYLEGNPPLLNKSLIAFRGTVEHLVYHDYEELGKQMIDIVISDESIEKTVKVEVIPADSSPSKILVKNRMDKLEELGTLYQGDEVIVYGYVDDIDDVFSDSPFATGIRATIIELVK